jgi:hypothetical protein
MCFFCRSLSFGKSPTAVGSHASLTIDRVDLLKGFRPVILNSATLGHQDLESLLV